MYAFSTFLTACNDYTTYTHSRRYGIIGVRAVDFAALVDREYRHDTLPLVTQTRGNSYLLCFFLLFQLTP